MVFTGWSFWAVFIFFSFVRQCVWPTLLCVYQLRNFRKSERLEKGKWCPYSCLSCLLSPPVVEPTAMCDRVTGCHVLGCTWCLRLPWLCTTVSTFWWKEKRKGAGRRELSWRILLWCFSKGKEQKEYTSRLKSKTKPQLCNFEWFLNHQNWHYFLKH